jgi:hypothetical protein
MVQLPNGRRRHIVGFNTLRKKLFDLVRKYILLSQSCSIDERVTDKDNVWIFLKGIISETQNIRFPEFRFNFGVFGMRAKISFSIFKNRTIRIKWPLMRNPFIGEDDSFIYTKREKGIG